jgi:drug/metabolite transporter (DMT)-like permease
VSAADILAGKSGQLRRVRYLSPMKYLLVLLSVLMTIASALLLDFAADRYKTVSLVVFFLLGTAVFVNVVKFVFWGWLLKRYDLSTSYPLTSIFFPLIFLTAWLREDNFRAEWPQWLGMALIVAGILFFIKNPSARTEE